MITYKAFVNTVTNGQLRKEIRRITLPDNARHADLYHAVQILFEING